MRTIKLDPKTSPSTQIIRERTPRRTSSLVCSSNEAHECIQGKATQALIVTGSEVSTLSRKFYDTHLSHVRMQPVTQLLTCTLQCADGTELPYHMVSLFVRYRLMAYLNHQETINCLFLVVNETTYHESVPVLIETNILSIFLKKKTRNKYGVMFLPFTMVSCVEVSHDKGKEARQ